MFIDDVTEKFNFFSKEGTFVEVEYESSPTQRTEDSFDVPFVLLMVLAVDENIIEIDDAELVDISL